MSCSVCGQRGLISMGGVLLCRDHAEDVRIEIDRLRAEGKPVSVVGIARRMYREAVGGTSVIVLKDFPEALKERAKLRAVRDKTNIRELALIGLERELDRRDAAEKEG
jgi:hypothetical protein